MTPRLRTVALGALLAGSSVVTEGCKREGSTAATSEDGARKRRGGPRLPDPLKLPADPELAIYLKAPATLLEEGRAYADGLPPDAELVDRVLDGIGRPALEDQLGDAIALDRPWILARVEGESIVGLPIADQRADAVAAILSPLTPEGKFGAVRLPAPSADPPRKEPPVLAWLDRTGPTLYFAETPRGLATGPHLEKAYGRAPIYATVGRAVGELIDRPLPFSRLTISGTGAAAFEARLEGLDEGEIPEIGELSNGALTGMVRAPQVAWGVSTRWSGHEEAVASIISELTMQVRDQNFLIRGVLEDLLRKLNSVLRTWDGRVLLGSGPANHVLLALGTDDPPRAERALLHLVRGLLDNLKLADTFGFDVPSISLKKNVASAGAVKVHQITMRGARAKLPPELAPLLDGDRIHVALAFPPHAASALIVTGPSAAEAAARWARETEGKIEKDEGLEDLLAASFAIKPESLRPVVEEQSPLGAISLDADRSPTLATVRREGDALVLRVREVAN